MTNRRHKIIPYLWYDTQAKEAAEFYCSLIPESEISHISVLHDTPSGDCDVVSFRLSGQPFMAISAGPYFKFNPSISFFLNFDPSKDKNARKNLDATWKKLSSGGTVLMDLDKYPFSERYGWLQDKYGLSWQLILSDPGGEERPFIVPSLLFTDDVCGKAEEAVKFYLSVFSPKDGSASGGGNSKQGIIARYPGGMEPDKEGTVMYTDFMIEQTWFAAMDSAREHNYAFNEAISFMIACETQEEIDYYWKKLSAVPQAEQCGWCKDKYGVSWQVHPAIMDEMMNNGTREQIDRLTKAFLPMKKFDIAALKKAFEQK